jgi:threonine/homoserine/homoserine lactone efflux protein
MEPEQMLAFWGVSTLFVITPGADWAFAISAGIAGRRSVIPAVAGLLSGHLIATAVVALGVGTILAGFPIALTVLTIGGASYLIWLGIGTFRSASAPGTSVITGTGNRERWLLKGAGVSGLNPKVFLLFLALLPQFTRAGAEMPLSLQIVTLGLVHTATCAVVYLLVGFTAGLALQRRPCASRIVTRCSGALMVAIGAFLLGEQVVRATQHLVA